MNKLCFKDTSRVASIVRTMQNDCKKLEDLVMKSQLLDEIVERSKDTEVTIMFGGESTKDIVGNLNLKFKQEDVNAQLRSLNESVDCQIRDICNKYPYSMFPLGFVLPAE